ncbi:CATRA system-associated protein [Herbidospora sp. RD11066]
MEISDFEWDADVLDDLPEWRLSIPRWERVREALDACAVAVAARDVHAVRDAIAALELLGPTRVTRIGAVPVVAPPPEVVERRDHLVHSLRPSNVGGRDDERPDAS